MGTSVIAKQRLFDLVNSSLEVQIQLPDEQAAEKLDARVRVYDTIDFLNENSYIEIGRIAHEMDKRKLWQHVVNPKTGETCSSFNEWTKSCPSSCRAKIWAAKGTFEDLSVDLRPEQMDGVPRGKLKVLCQLSSKVRTDDEILKAAQDTKKSVSDFRKIIEEKEPEQLIEHLEPFKLNPTASQKTIYDGAVSKAMGLGAKTREEAWEYVAQAYLTEPDDGSYNEDEFTREEA
jgi:hypothetical protein